MILKTFGIVNQQGKHNVIIIFHPNVALINNLYKQENMEEDAC